MLTADRFRDAARAYLIYGIVYWIGGVYLAWHGVGVRGGRMMQAGVLWIVLGLGIVIAVPYLLARRRAWFERWVLSRRDFARILSLLMAFHYERNDWTSGIEGDVRNGSHEDIFQGEATFTYRMTGRVRFYAGVQRSSRKQSFEEGIAKNTNVGIGLSGLF